MFRKLVASVAVCACLIYPNGLRAEPGPIVSWLMGEPASLFDIGMLRLEMELSTWGENDVANAEGIYGLSGHYSAKYDWAQNRIIIDGLFLPDLKPQVPLNTQTVRPICKRILTTLALHVNVDPEGALFPNNEGSALAVLFAHNGYRTRNQPPGYLRRLDKIFVLQAKVPFDPEGNYQFCKRSLLSSQVLYEE